MYVLGTILIVSGSVASLLASVSYVMATRDNAAALTYGRMGVRVALGAALLAVALLIYAFVARRYDITYVYSYSSNELNLRYRVAAMWAGQPGSFAIWALWGLIIAQILIRRAGRAEPYVLSVFMLIEAALLTFALFLNPFAPYRDQNGLLVSPANGTGLNELLENPWMVIHPPILFAGYALLAAPFAFAIGGLWRRDYDSWVDHALPWALAGWSALGAALLMGGYWAYETQNWGGYWGWDSVENSSLVAWLSATALLHALVLQRARGGLRRTTFALAILTYLLVFYATYLTRSGVLANFSVHTFAMESIQLALTITLALLIIGGVAALAWRWRDIPIRPLAELLLSRESFFALLIVGLLVIAAVIAIGTSMPLISVIPGVGQRLQDAMGAAFDLDYGTRFTQGLRPFSDGRFALTFSFYTTTAPPLGLILVALLTVGPLLGWRDTNLRHLLRALRWPALAAVAVASGALLLGVRDALPLLYLSLGAFAAGTNLVMIARTLRGGWLRIGGYLAHVGMVVFIAGVIGSTTYASPEQKLVLPESEIIRAYGYDFTFNGWRVTPDNKGVLDLTVTRDGASFQALPQLYYIPRREATLLAPAIKRELLRDLYITPVSYQQPVDRNTADFGFNDTRAIGPYTITFLGFDAADLSGSDAGAKLQVQYQGATIELTPRLQPSASDADSSRSIQPLQLPGGQTLALESIDPLRRMARVRVNGMNLPVDPGLAVVTIGLKPGIALVWLGVVIGVMGGLVALLRRTIEGRARLAGQPARLPRGLGGIGLLFGRQERVDSKAKTVSD